MTRYLDETLRLLNYADRTHEPRVGDRGVAGAEVRGVDRSNRLVHAILSTPRVDRYGEVILPQAFEAGLDAFMRDPKFLASHLYATPSGEPTSIGVWTDVRVTDEGLIGTAKFMDGDDLAEKWWRRFEQGVTRSFSVGFVAEKWEMRSVRTGGSQKKVRHFTQVQLIEVSAVEVPANPDALVRSLYAGYANREALARSAASAGERPRAAEGPAPDQSTIERRLNALENLIAKWIEPRLEDLEAQALDRSVTTAGRDAQCHTSDVGAQTSLGRAGRMAAHRSFLTSPDDDSPPRAGGSKHAPADEPADDFDAALAGALGAVRPR